MDSTTLVSDMIADGNLVATELRAAGFDVTAAAWLKRAEDGLWRLFVISAVAESQRPKDAYGQMLPLIRKIEGLNRIDPHEVRLIGPNHHLAKLVIAHQRKFGSLATTSMPWIDQSLAGPAYESAYLYPLPS